MPDYSKWKITLEQFVTDFERENLTHDPGKTPSGYSQWFQYEDGRWDYLTEGWEQWRAIARAFLGSDDQYNGLYSASTALFWAQPKEFTSKYKWNGPNFFPYTTMPADVPIRMPYETVKAAGFDKPDTDDIKKKANIKKKATNTDLVLKPEPEDSTSTGAAVAKVAVVGGATIGAGYVIWRLWPQILRFFR